MRIPALHTLIALPWLLAFTTVQAAAPTENVILQVSGTDFPLLILHLAQLDESGLPAPLACEQIRAKRVDELDPRWKRAVERIHLECDELQPGTEDGLMVATEILAYLRPGTVQLAGVPVVELRMADSELWGDRQYLLGQPFEEIAGTLQRHMEARCQMQSDDPTRVVAGDCAVTVDPRGLYLRTSEVSGIWVHADPDNPQRTVYAESWAD